MTSKRWSKYAVCALLAAVALVVPAAVASAAAPAKAVTCTTCHADFASVLPKAHPAVAGKTLAACFACHKPAQAGNAKPDRYVSALHRAHAAGAAAVDCATCHVARGKGPVAVVSGKVALPVTAEALKALQPVMVSWATSAFLDGFHAKGGVGCGGCHGAAVPAPGAEIGNERCLACHGPMEQLVEKTKPAQFADRNPHRSHLGEIACTVCHKGHEASLVYCLDCHRKFEMKIVGAGPR
ncbi:MAG: cytochrome c3 family protein [Burkholderiales bacterium]